MDLTRLAVDAGQFINRAVQYTGESLGQAEKTDLDPGLEELLGQIDATKTWTDLIVSQTEAVLQPSTAARLEERLYEHLDWPAPTRPRAQELLGEQMIQAGLEMGTNSPYGTSLLRCGEVQKQLGEAQRKFAQSANIHFLSPLRRFGASEYKTMQEERRMLLNKRLDLDVAKSRLRRAHEAEQESRNLNANPLEDDYFSSHVSYMFRFMRVRWMKMWAQEISQAETELRICETLFHRQTEITRQLLGEISNTHEKHMQSLNDFVDAQMCYYAQCKQHALELQKQLASIPAVLCSNKWQSSISNGASNHSEPSPAEQNGLDSSIVVVHHLPEFDQDSWTTEGCTNNNNNNREPDHTHTSEREHPPSCEPTSP
ncbi:endophilin-B1-like [Corythoichthys intestinalis]|uniref:endophilin-B1-like n=1 Tax=Corythoichthys intestinalis TaxID=161448 RepID=UPI0025A51055|nr:endophilin-B1-like [Corythoichthys intestinalis]XP_061798292.1 endophilin-B1-like [Nerophis lumbriciformis]